MVPSAPVASKGEGPRGGKPGSPAAQESATSTARAEVWWWRATLSGRGVAKHEERDIQPQGPDGPLRVGELPGAHGEVVRENAARAAVGGGKVDGRRAVAACGAVMPAATPPTYGNVKDGGSA